MAYYTVGATSNANLILTFSAAPVSSTSGTLDTITTSGTYNQTGPAYVVADGGGGNGGNANGNYNGASSGGGGAGGITASFYQLTGSTSVTIGGAGGGTTTFGNLSAAGGNNGGNGEGGGGSGGAAGGSFGSAGGNGASGRNQVNGGGTAPNTNTAVKSFIVRFHSRKIICYHTSNNMCDFCFISTVQMCCDTIHTTRCLLDKDAIQV